MLLFGQQPVGRANLRFGAVAVQTERRVMIDFSALQCARIPVVVADVSFIAANRCLNYFLNGHEICD